jgi:hypothetical protein
MLPYFYGGIMAKRSEEASQMRLSLKTGVFRIITVFLLVTIILMFNVQLTLSNGEFMVVECIGYDRVLTGTLVTRPSSDCMGG